MYMFSYVNVFGVPVPQPSSVSVYLRVRVKSTVYVNPSLLVTGSPVHRDNSLLKLLVFSHSVLGMLPVAGYECEHWTSSSVFKETIWQSFFTHAGTKWIP